MIYEVIKEIKNSCSNNQMRDIFYEECEISDPDEFIRQREPSLTSFTREEIAGGYRYYVDSCGITTVYNLTEV